MIIPRCYYHLSLALFKKGWLTSIRDHEGKGKPVPGNYSSAVGIQLEQPHLTAKTGEQ